MSDPTPTVQPMSQETYDNGDTQASSAEHATPVLPSSDDNLTCLWEKCGERLTSAETLFEHICEKHIGRKTTNNLNLACGWRGCSVSTVKRDHITSHIRVHVPLKPYQCEFCGKAFKRPQDLKKHVKTHADESMLLRGNGQNQRNAYRQGGKVIANLQNVPANPVYNQHAQMSSHPAIPYGYSTQTSGHGSYYNPQPTHMTFPPVYYAVNDHTVTHQQHQQAAYESKKRSFDVLNEFFGDAKRRQIDPTSYAQVGQRLTALSGLPIQGGLVEYVQPAQALLAINSHGPGGHQSGPMPQHQYSLPPMPNLRTKNDLLNIDQFLEQMQSTIYESSNAAAAAGIQQAGAHYTPQAVNFRSSHSPTQAAGHAPFTTGTTTAPMTSTHPRSSHSSIATPALTPSSSTMSYHSSDSPISSASTGMSMSPLSQTSNPAIATYPSLPPVTSSLCYNTHPHSQPANHGPISTLGSAFDSDPRRRYSGGMLQRARSIDRPKSQLVDNSNSPARRVTTTPNIDPSLSTLQSPVISMSSESGDSARDRAEEVWIENIRVIEALRSFIKRRLEMRFYEDGEDDVGMRAAKQLKEQEAVATSRGLYPTIRVDHTSGMH